MKTLEAAAINEMNSEPTARHNTRRKRSQLPPWLLPLVPALLLITGLLVWPMLQAAIESVRVDGVWSLDAYSQVFGNDVFRQALVYTLLFTFVTIAFEFALGFGAASLLNNLRSPWKRYATGAVLLPYLIAPVAAGLIWRLMLDYSIGTINWAIGLVGLGPINWLGESGAAFWATVIAETWRSTPFVVIILVAAMAALPGDVLEASKVDGAGRWRTLLYIKLPLLRPAIAVALLFQTIFKLRLFELPFILTGGGPGSSTTPLGLLVHQYYFRYANIPTASVVSVVLLIIGVIIAVAYMRWVYREVEY